MSGPPRYVSEEVYLEMLQEVEVASARNRLPGDWHGLRTRRQALAQLIEEERFERSDPKSGAWPFRLERAVTVRILAADLLPVVRSRLMVELRSRDVEPSLWTPIDVRADEMRAPLLRRAYAAEADVLSALERCARAPTYASARSALRALEELHDVREGLDPLFDVDQLARARHTLADAVKAVVPYSACHLIGMRIREAFETEIAVSPFEVDITGDFGLYSTRDQPWSHPVWEALCMKDFVTADPLATVFVRGVQKDYEQVHARTTVERREHRKWLKSTEPEGRRWLEAANGVHSSDPVEDDVHQQPTAITQTERMPVLPEPPPPRLGDLEAERERERQRAAEIQASFAEIEAAERREAAQRHERAERRRNHRLHLPRVQSNANRKEVKRYLKSRGIGPQELTPRVRQAFKRQFAV